MTPRVLAGAVASAAALLASGCGSPPADNRSTDVADKGAPRPERAVTLPPYPKAGDLLRFDTGPRSTFEFYVDGRALSVGADGIVRFTVVAKTDTATNVSYEGFRCATRERTVYAYGRPDGTWHATKDPSWERLGPAVTEGYRYFLYWEYFCPATTRIRNAAEGIDALKRGGRANAD